MNGSQYIVGRYAPVTGEPWWILTLDDVPQALRVQQLLQAGHLLLQLPHQPVVGVFVDDGVAADLLGSVSVSGSRRETTRLSSAPPTSGVK